MITAKIILDSLNSKNARIITMELTFPMYLLAQFNKHRVFSSNSASSRAIPYEKFKQSIIDDPYIPFAWQKTHKGMQGREYFESRDEILELEFDWKIAKGISTILADDFDKKGVTKQICNQLIKPYAYTKVILTATDWDNFFRQRCPIYRINDFIYYSRKEAIKNYPEYINYTLLDWLKINEGEADVHMMLLAEAIYDAKNESVPVYRKYHFPYITEEEFKLYNIQELKLLSVSRCAQVSYTPMGEVKNSTFEKLTSLANKLKKEKHLTPFEHIATDSGDLERYANFTGWISYRKEIE
jgi:hypothetical protein